MHDHLVLSRHDSVLTLRLNRPEARNALTYEMYEGLAQACRQASTDDSVRVVVIAGDASAFGSGTDIALFRDLKTKADAHAYEARMEAVFRAIETCTKPVIAAIAGACTGGAACIAACCDLRLGAADARIGFPIARTLGNVLSSRNFARLVRLVGVARVKEMVFTARLLDGRAALAAGFLNECLPDASALYARVSELAHTIAGHAPLTLSATKQLLDRIGENEWFDDDLVALCYTSDDFREGMEAFLMKRRPDWRGA